ncbi:TolC family protein, partial [bacterium]|nr:TolC family protein [bacterium]
MRLCFTLRPLLFGVAVVVWSVVFAQPSISPSSLAEIFTALENTSPELWDARVQVAGARTEAASVRAIPNPALFGTNEELSGDGETLRETTIGVRQEFGFIWSRRPSLNAAKSALNAAELTLQERRLAVQSDLLLKLLRLDQLSKEIELLDTLAVKYSVVSNAANAREREGDISGYDAIRVRMKGPEVYENLAALRTEVRLLLTYLQRMTGLAEADLRGVDLSAVLDIPFASSQEAVSYAREHSPEMKRIASQEVSATSALNAAKWNRLPEFSIGIGQKQTNRSENGLYIEGELEIPLFSQGNLYVQSARVQADRAAELRTNLDRRLESEVTRAYVQWNSLKAAPMLNVTP